METNKTANDSQDINVRGIEWTGRQSDLIELIYALHASKTINHGQLSLNELKKKVEILFGIELGNLPGKLKDISLRKDPTQFLEKLKKELDELLDRLMK